MKHFAQLFYDLDQTNKTNEKVEIIVNYLKKVPDEDKMWMLSLFTGRRPRRFVNSTLVRNWASEAAGVPLWLFEECYTIAGDLSETIALLLPEPSQESNFSLGYWINYIRLFEKKTEEERKQALLAAWDQMTAQERMVFNKITSSTFRVGVSQQLVVRALSIYSGHNPALLTHKLMGNWSPDTISFEELMHADGRKADTSQPYPFMLAYAIEGTVSDLGSPEEWQAEWKWDGIRSQLIKRDGQMFLWSRGEDLVTEKFPEFGLLMDKIPDGTVIDGEILPFKEGGVLSFNVLQTRIGRKNLTPAILRDAPVCIFAYDLLELEGEDLRERPLSERRRLLEQLIQERNLQPMIEPSPVLEYSDWDQLTEMRRNSRAMLSEGLMMKRKSSHYLVGRKKGDWWKWKIDPLSIDAVMTYAQRGTGKRANLYTDYTFGVWSGKQLVTFAKAYSGLTDKEINEVDNWVKRNTVEKYGPVRTVKPELVFEIGFEGIQRSKRHKSGVALRFPRILKWRKDKKIADADTVETLHQILDSYEKGDINELELPAAHTEEIAPPAKKTRSKSKND